MIIVDDAHHFFLVALFVLAGTLPLFIYRIIRGPHIFDRLIGLNGIATKSILFLIFAGALIGQTEMIIDICLGYGLINLVGALAIGKYFEVKGLEE